MWIWLDLQINYKWWSAFDRIIQNILSLFWFLVCWQEMRIQCNGLRALFLWYRIQWHHFVIKISWLKAAPRYISKGFLSFVPRFSGWNQFLTASWKMGCRFNWIFFQCLAKWNYHVRHLDNIKRTMSNALFDFHMNICFASEDTYCLYCLNFFYSSTHHVKTSRFFETVSSITSFGMGAMPCTLSYGYFWMDT